MSRFKDLAGGVIKMGRWTLPIFVLSMLGIVVGLACFKADYLSSYGGYIDIGTRKAEGTMFGYGLADIIALAPQVVQLIFLYVIGSSNSDRKLTLMELVLYIFIWLGCFIFDTGTDMYFKAHGMSFWYWAVAFVETIFVNTIISEITLVVSIGLFLELAVPSVKILFDLIIDLADMIIEGITRGANIVGNAIETGKREIGDTDETEIKINGMRR